MVDGRLKIFTHKEQTQSSAKTIRIEETQRLGYGLRLLGEYTLRGFRPSVRKEATWGTALYSPIGKLETLIRILIGVQKRGEVDGAIFG